MSVENSFVIGGNCSLTSRNRKPVSQTVDSRSCVWKSASTQEQVDDELGLAGEEQWSGFDGGIGVQWHDALLGGVDVRAKTT